MLQLYNTERLLVIPNSASDAAEKEQAVARWHLRPSALQLRRHALCLMVLTSCKAMHARFGEDVACQWVSVCIARYVPCPCTFTPPLEKPRHGRQLHCGAWVYTSWDSMREACALLVQAASLDDVACPSLDQLDLLLVSAGTTVPSVISAASDEARRAGEAAPCQQHCSGIVNGAAWRLWKCMTLWDHTASGAAGHRTALRSQSGMGGSSPRAACCVCTTMCARKPTTPAPMDGMGTAACPACRREGYLLHSAAALGEPELC